MNTPLPVRIPVAADPDAIIYERTVAVPVTVAVVLGTRPEIPRKRKARMSCATDG